MKNHLQNLFVLPALMAGLGLILTNPATAQTFTPLYSFTNSPDGAYPQGNLVLSGNTLYGTTSQGGILNSNNGLGNGTVFAININGSNYTNLYLFGSTNNDGAIPYGVLVLSGNTLYGAADQGGSYSNGTLFSLNTSGSNYVILHQFGPTSLNNAGQSTNSDGAGPQESGLILSGNTLYGTAIGGGVNGSGTVFSLNTSGSNYITLHNFGPWGYDASFQTTNNYGANPESTLLISGNTLYGITVVGGTNGNGTVFSMSTGGSNFMILHTFGAWGLNTNLNSYTNNDGAYPQGAGLILSGNTLYGTTCEGGTNAHGVSAGGTVFSLNTSGSNFTVLHDFSGGGDGSTPFCGLSLSGNTLYGTTEQGGTNGFGTVFSLNTSGTNFSVLYTFNGTPDGYFPEAGLILSGNTLYGTTTFGGTNGYGMVFSLTVTLSVTPQLAIALSGTNVILNWPTNAAGFTLESATNLVSSAIWITNAPPPVVVGTNNAVTNGISGIRKFYRLISQ
jgi:uncharacterized repeat protein (TIGR03803 family)